MKKLLILVMMIFSCQLTFAVDDDFWLDRQVKIGDGQNKYDKRIYGQYARTVYESRTNLTTGQKENVKALIERSVVVDKPTPTKVGGAMFKRLSASLKAPGVQMLGVAAVVELIEAIGWVMEDGAYVKYKEPDSNGFEYKCTYDYATCTWVSTASLAVQQIKTANGKVLDPAGNKLVIKSASVGGNNPDYHAVVTTAILNTSGSEYNTYTSTSVLQRRPKTVEKEKVPLTPALLGAAMLGDGYSDPVDDSANDKINTGDYTGVAETYQHDESGVGNEVAEALDEKAKNAKPTPDGKPAPIGDLRYDDSGPLVHDDISKDRKWEEDGDTATGETKPTTDPETGEQTGGQSISLQFPVFCTWAFKVCEWYDSWKKTDKWLKEEPDLQDEQLEVEEQNITDYSRQDYVTFGKTCPFSPHQVSIPMGLLGEINFEADLTYICTFGEQARPFIIGIGYLGGLIFLLIGLRNGNG